ncbi:DUF397 domain-containing protein [Nocardia macrotermitis]|uniref:DUF397 domain-containing protein n=1 Tax=Nocardia macrotermitis TaxID=2585198 RepID=A0A7K0D4Q6_9NOCA|nr:DUF397 domain-containing protein [Nocardia macrotermitis]MQY20709.1 hypothetical protein [Nocardia macrotermitis]
MSEAQISGETSWFKSSFSRDAATCVEVRFTRTTVLIRDSKYFHNPANPPAAQPIITIPIESWTRFLDLVLGQDVSAPGLPAVRVHPDGGATLTAENGTALTYTPAEWVAYTSGVRVGEFAAA